MVTKGRNKPHGNSEYTIGEISGNSDRQRVWMGSEYRVSVDNFLAQIVNFCEGQLNSNGSIDEADISNYKKLLALFAKYPVDFRFIDFGKSRNHSRRWFSETTNNSDTSNTLPAVGLRNSKRPNQVGVFSLKFNGKIEGDMYDFLKKILPEAEKRSENNSLGRAALNVSPTVRKKVEKVVQVNPPGAIKHDSGLAISDNNSSTQPVDPVAPIDSSQKSKAIMPSHMANPIDRLIQYLNLEKDDMPPEKDERLPPFIAARILRQALLYPNTLTIDKEKGIYFIPDVTIRGIFEVGEILDFRFNKGYLTESAIVDNIFYTLREFGGTFVTVLSLNIDKLEKKEQDSTSRVKKLENKEIVDLITKEERRHPINVAGESIAIIKHHGIRIASQLLTDLRIEHLSTVYGIFNESDQRTKRTLTKGYCVIIPPHFDLNQQPDHGNMDITALVDKLQELKARRTDLTSKIDTVTETMSGINQEIGKINGEMNDLQANEEKQKQIMARIQSKALSNLFDDEDYVRADLTPQRKVQLCQELIRRVEAFMSEQSMLDGVKDVQDISGDIQNKQNQLDALDRKLRSLEDRVTELNVTLSEVSASLTYYTTVRDQLVAKLTAAI